MPWFSKKEEPPAEPKAPEPSAPELPPAFVTQDQFSQVNQRLEQLTGALIGNQQGQQAPALAPEPEIPDVTDEEIQQAWATATESGELADIQRARAAEQKRTNANQVRLERTLNCRIQQLEEQGTQWVGGIQEKFAKQSLEGKEYYQVYKKEIDAQIAQIPVAQRTPEILDAVYKYVIGDKQEEIFEKKMEARARQAEEVVAADSNNRTGRAQGGNMSQDEATFANVFGESLAGQGARWEGGGDLWTGRHRNPDEFARNLGYEDANAYARASQAIMAVEDCPNCFAPMTESIQGGSHDCPIAVSTHRLGLPGLR